MLGYVQVALKQGGQNNVVNKIKTEKWETDLKPFTIWVEKLFA